MSKCVFELGGFLCHNYMNVSNNSPKRFYYFYYTHDCTIINTKMSIFSIIPTIEQFHFACPYITAPIVREFTIYTSI